MPTARRVAARVTAVLLVVLLGTGIWLWGNYRPTAPAAWNDVLRDLDPGGEQLWRAVHRWAGLLLPFSAAVLGILHAAARARRLALLALGTTGLAALTALTGYFLPWDQLALRSVTVGDSIRGMGVLWDQDVLFVLMGDEEVQPGTVRRWAVLHVALAAVPLVAAVVVAVRRWGRPRRGPDPACSTTTSRT